MACEASEDDVSKAQVYVRGVAVGMGLVSCSREAYAQVLRDCFCLKHCNALHEHLAYVERNAGLPVPWSESEPTVDP